LADSKPDSCNNFVRKTGFFALFTGYDEISMLLLEFTAGEIQITPVGAPPSARIAARRRSHCKGLCNDWGKNPCSDSFLSGYKHNYRKRTNNRIYPLPCRLNQQQYERALVSLAK
jgi:hypothetical protein